MSRLLGAGVFFAMTLIGQTAAAEVSLSMRSDRTAMSGADQLRVQISVESEGGSAPDVELPSFEGFEILSQQVQRPMQFSFSFGSRAVVKSSAIYTFLLRPTRTGKIRIEPVRASVGGQTYASKPLEIQVSGAGTPLAPGQGQGQGAAPDDDSAAASDSQAPAAALDRPDIDPIAFVRPVVDKAAPYVGEQVTVTIYLYTRQRLQSSPIIDSEPTTEGFWTHDLLGPTYNAAPSRQSINGTFYYVYALRRFAAFPLKDGPLTIGPLALHIDTTSVFDIFGSRQTDPVIKRSGKPLTLDVQPLPAEGRPAGDVAVGRLSLSAEVDRAQSVTGDAITLTAVVEGEGNLRTVKLATPEIPGIEVLDPQIREQIESPNDLLSGRREYRWLLVSDKPGEFTVPPLTLNTFDRDRGYTTLRTNPIALKVVGDPVQLSATTGAAPGGDDAAPADDGAPSPERFGPIRTQSALSRGHTALVQRAFFPWAVALPPILWLAVVATGFTRRRLRARSATGPLRAAREAEEALDKAQRAARQGEASSYHAAAAATVHALLESKLGEAVRGLTRGELAQQLDERGLSDELRTGVVELLERSEFARFGSAGEAPNLPAEAGRLKTLYQGLSSWRPREEAA